jgi:hypothetical protein
MKLRYLSINQLSELTGKDRRTIKKRLADVAVHETTATSIIYDTHLALPVLFGLTDTENAEARLQEEKIKFEAARAERTEIEVAKIKGELVSIEEVAKTVELEYTYVRAHLVSIPSKAAKTLSLIDDPALVKARLEEYINEALVELSADNEMIENVQRASNEALKESTSDVEAETET